MKHLITPPLPSSRLYPPPDSGDATLPSTDRTLAFSDPWAPPSSRAPACVCNVSVLQSQSPRRPWAKASVDSLLLLPRSLIFLFPWIALRFPMASPEGSVPHLLPCLPGTRWSHIPPPLGPAPSQAGTAGGGPDVAPSSSVPQTLHKGAELFKETKARATQRLGQRLAPGSRAERAKSCSPYGTPDRASLGPRLLGVHTRLGVLPPVTSQSKVCSFGL